MAVGKSSSKDEHRTMGSYLAYSPSIYDRRNKPQVQFLTSDLMPVSYRYHTIARGLFLLAMSGV